MPRRPAGLDVDLEATPGNKDHALASWSVNGEVDAAPPRSTPIQFTIPADNPTVTATFTECYTLDVVIGGAQDPYGKDIGRFTNATAPNCVDGSKRYVEGTVVTLTPSILVDKAVFTGWDGDKRELTPPPAGISALAGNAKAAAVFDLIDPTKILTCAALWAFNNTTDPTGNTNIGSIVSTANKMRQVLMGTDITKVNISNAGGLAGSAGFVLGLYSAGITNAPDRPPDP